MNKIQILKIFFDLFEDFSQDMFTEKGFDWRKKVTFIDFLWWLAKHKEYLLMDIDEE